MNSENKKHLNKVWYKMAVAFMALALMVMACPMSAFAKVTSGTMGYDNTISWTYDSDTRILTLTGEGAGFDWSALKDIASGKMRQIVIEDAVFTGQLDSLFAGLTKVESITFKNVDTSQVTNMAGMFDGCNSLTSLDLSEFDTENVTNMYAMFNGCNSLTSLDLSSFDTSNLADMQLMFNKCSSLTELDVSSFNTENVTSMYGLFKECSSLTDLDLSGFDTANAEIMGEMFFGCSGLTDLKLSSDFNTEKVCDMTAMFSGCSSLTSLNLNSFDTENVESMKSMFQDCFNLKDLDISSFRTGIVTDMREMFYDCNSLTSLDLSGFDTEYVGDMGSMFYGCSSLTSLDLSSFDTSCLYNTQFMFYNCSKLTELDLSNFDMSGVVYSGWELAGARKIKTIHTPQAMGEFALILPDYFLDEAGKKYDTITKDICDTILTREPSPFADVPENSWQYEYVKFVYNRELMKGKDTDDNGYIIFDPNKEMTRAEFVQTLYNKEGKPYVSYTNRFKDVPANQWYTSAILWAAENNIVAGKGDGYFDVSGNITREEMATILCKYAKNYRGYNSDKKAELSAFTDVNSISSWAVDNMKWAVANNIMKGKGEEIAPKDNATRAECATMLRNFMFTFEPYDTY